MALLVNFINDELLFRRKILKVVYYYEVLEIDRLFTEFHDKKTLYWYLFIKKNDEVTFWPKL